MVRISAKIFLEMNGTKVRLKIGTLHDRLCFFLDNYREYDYLPQEDMAVHKSVSCYVDRKYRKQATAKTCYVRQEGYFLPQTGEFVEPALRRSYSDKLRWFKADDALCLDEEFVSRYFDMIFEYLMEHAVLRRDERYE